MNSYNKADEKRKIIMDHYTNPRNKKAVDKNNFVEVLSNHCVDKLRLTLVVENDLVKDAYFDGEGCAIFYSSTDIMIDTIRGMKKDQILDLLLEYKKMIFQVEKYDKKKLGKLTVFEHVSSNFNRTHCAKMIETAIKKYFELKK